MEQVNNGHARCFCVNEECGDLKFRGAERFCPRCGGSDIKVDTTVVNQDKDGNNLFPLSFMDVGTNKIASVFSWQNTIVTVTENGSVSQYADEDVCNYVCSLANGDNLPQVRAVFSDSVTGGNNLKVRARVFNGILLLPCEKTIYTLDLLGSVRFAPIRFGDCSLVDMATDGKGRLAALLKYGEDDYKVRVYEFDCRHKDEFVLFYELRVPKDSFGHLYLTSEAIYLLGKGAENAGRLRAFSLASFSWFDIEGDYGYLKSYDDCESLLLRRIRGVGDRFGFQIVRLGEKLQPKFFCNYEYSQPPKSYITEGSYHYLLGSDFVKVDVASGTIVEIMKDFCSKKMGGINVCAPPKFHRGCYYFVHTTDGDHSKVAKYVEGAFGFNRSLPLKTKGNPSGDSISLNIPLLNVGSYILAVQNNSFVAFSAQVE